VHEIHKRHPSAHFFVGLGLEKWFRRAGINQVTELDWWEDVDVNLTPKPLANDDATATNNPPSKSESIATRISCLPSQHTSGRTGLDKDTTLWCSWAVESGGKSVYFGGDTGYRAVPDVPAGVDDRSPDYAKLPTSPQFAQIGHLRGPFDLGLIPIGAYSPRAIMSPVHANPFDAVDIFRDTRCRRAMGIHWGTWVLTVEDTSEPPVKLREALKRRGLEETGVFDVCEIGESREF
jgi:L-ascorbate metabolism protein UlaG (beta-lactamase superfamily)